MGCDELLRIPIPASAFDEWLVYFYTHGLHDVETFAGNT